MTINRLNTTKLQTQKCDIGMDKTIIQQVIKVILYLNITLLIGKTIFKLLNNVKKKNVNDEIN